MMARTNELSSGKLTRLTGLPFPRWVAVGLLAGAGASLVVVYLFDPRQSGLYPLCPFFGLTGWHCPGCGTLRAFHQAMHGNIAAAFGYNAFTMLALPAVACSLAVKGLCACRLSAPARMFNLGPWTWALPVSILTFWLLRNLPFGPFNVLAP